jgi:glycerol-3-phosphate dehydrogenase
MNRDLTQLSDRTFDVLIVGGGIHGACLVWDATLRGLSAALIERGDFGQETSANSLKTVHGGLRYLQDADVGLVRSMIHERSAYLRIAPHLVQPLGCLMPTYKKLMKSKPVMTLALKMNDLMGYDRNQDLDPERILPASRLISPQEVFRLLPGLPAEGVSGGVIWYDGQMFNSERLTLSFILSAAQKGAVVTNYVEAIGFLQDGKRVGGVKARDTLSGNVLEIQAKVVVNAAGPWVDRVLSELNGAPVAKKFNHSLAMNLVTRKFIDEYAAGIPSRPKVFLKNGQTMKSRVMFIAPWREYSIVGTFHTHFHGEPDDFILQENDLELFLNEVNSAYPGAGLQREDICFIHKGFLPARSDVGNGEVKLIREGQVFDHQQTDGLGGLITVMGVKYTSARKVAARGIDLVFRFLGKTPPPCTSDVTPLHDGAIDSISTFMQAARKDLTAGFSPGLIDDLALSYGVNYLKVRNLILAEEPQQEINADSPAVVRALTHYAIQYEMAQKLADVILRRTALGSAGMPTEASLHTAEQVMATELGWDEKRRQQELTDVQQAWAWFQG